MKTQIRNALALVLLSSLALGTGALAQRGGRRARDAGMHDSGTATARADDTEGWTELGSRLVNGNVDHDSIAVGRADGTFRAIRVRVERGPIELYDVIVTFTDGTTFAPGTRLLFAEDSQTRVIDLPGQARAIRRVDFKYGNLVRTGSARVELWAR